MSNRWLADLLESNDARADVDTGMEVGISKSPGVFSARREVSSRATLLHPRKKFRTG